jgi:hypothetical protein
VPKFLARGFFFVLSWHIVLSPARSQNAFLLPSAKNGINYEFRLQTEGGVTPLRWTLVDGQMPPGIELLSIGVLKGTPTTSQQEPFVFTVEVADSQQPPQRITQRFSLTVAPADLHFVLPAQTLMVRPAVPSEHEPERPQSSTLSEISYNSSRTPHWVVPLRRDDAGHSAVNSDLAAEQAQFEKSKPRPKNPLDPATFIRIFEDTKAGNRLTLYEPAKAGSKPALQLSADEVSSIAIEPSPDDMGDDPALNKLYITARLASGDSTKDLPVVGYAEVGKDKSTMAAQTGTAFQTAANVQAMILNMAYTVGDIIKYVYSPDEVFRESGTTKRNLSLQEWMDASREVDFKSKNVRDIDSAIATAIKTKQYDEDHIQRLRERFRLFQPEVGAISDFFTQKPNLAIVEKIGTAVFWIDHDSLARIAQQFKDNIRIAFDSNSTAEAQAKALQDLLERAKLVYKDFGDFRRDIKQLMPAGASFSSDEWTEKYQLAIQQYATDQQRKVFAELKKLLATGSISLTDNKAKDGDRLILTVESLPSDADTGGIPVVFEIAIRKYGAKIQWSPSLLFVRRLGVKDSEVTPPAGSTTAPITRVNFAPSPGMTFGVAYFHRGSSNWDKFVRSIGPGIGMNVSFMNYNDPSFNLATTQFSNTNGTNVQVGAGIIGSLFDNKLQLTYGWNLNVERRRTYFGVGFGFIEIGKEVAKYVTK